MIFFFYRGVTGWSIAVNYLPTILQRKNSAINIGLEKTYIDYLTAYTPGIAAVVLAVFMVRAPMVGRKWTLVLSSMVMGISLFLFSIVNTEASHVGFNTLEYFCQSLFNAAVSSLLSLITWSLKHVIAALRMDARGVPFCGAGDRHWFRLVLWRHICHLRSADRCATLQQHKWEQRRVVLGWQCPLCMYDCSVVPPDQGHGCTTIDVYVHVDVSTCYRSWGTNYIIFITQATRNITHRVNTNILNLVETNHHFQSLQCYSRSNILVTRQFNHRIRIELTQRAKTAAIKSSHSLRISRRRSGTRSGISNSSTSDL